jgi:carboxylesterase type B
MRAFTQVSEDCLYLNVFKPLNTTAPKPLPIMIFFYGGSWKEGSASFFLYNPSQIIGLVRDVIVVTTNYRLGAYGFLASPSLRAQDPDNSTGNYGLQDQVAALKVASSS